MSLEGLPRIAPGLPGVDALSPYQAAFTARLEYAGKPLVKDRKDDGSIRTLGREHRHDPEEDEHPAHDGQEPFSEEEAEQIRMFARMRGVMNFSMESGVRYAFRINEASGCVDLVNTQTGEVALQLQPEEMLRLSERIQRYAGFLTDRSG